MTKKKDSVSTKFDLTFIRESLVNILYALGYDDRNIVSKWSICQMLDAIRDDYNERGN